MLANFFDKTKPINSLAIGVLFAVFYLIFFLFQENPVFTDVSVLEKGSYLILNLLFLFFSGVVFIKNGTSKGNLYAPFLMVLLFGMFSATLIGGKTLIVLLLFVLLYWKISSFGIKTNRIASLFDSGLYLGVSILIFNWSVLYVLLLYFALILYRQINIRYLLVPIVGMLVPGILFYTYCLLTDTLPVFYESFHFSVSLDLSSYNNVSVQGAVLLISSVTLISILAVLPQVMSVSNSYRNQYSIILATLVIGIIIIILTPIKDGSEFLYVFLPASIIIAWFVQKIQKKIIKESVLLILTLFSLTLFFFSFK